MTGKKLLLWLAGPKASARFYCCVAMPLKYLIDVPAIDGDALVSWAGRIHGGLFVLLVALLFILRSNPGHELGRLRQVPDRFTSAVRHFPLSSRHLLCPIRHQTTAQQKPLREKTETCTQNELCQQLQCHTPAI